MKNLIKFLVIAAAVLFTAACSKSGTGGTSSEASSDPIENYEILTARENAEVGSLSFSTPVMEDTDMKVPEISEELTWLYATYPDLGSPQVKKGGVWKTWLSEYPTTFRHVGPESNVGTRSLMGMNMPLVGVNDETREFYSIAASHWAFSADGKTVYFKLREDVKWHDGAPCTADDYVFKYTSLKDPNAEDVWWEDHYNTRWAVKKINDYCIAVVSLIDEIKPKSSLLLEANMSPRAKHFYPNGITKGWYKDYNYKFEPTTGPYYMAEEENVKGELLVYKKVKDWWGHKVFGNGMANFDVIEYKIITGGLDIAREYFYKGELYTQGLNIPNDWRDAAGNEKIEKGYIDRWIFNYVPLNGISGIHFNTKAAFVNDVKVRQALYYAIDIQGMIDNALYSEYKRYHNIGMGHIWGGYDFDDHSIRKPDFDPKKASELLAAAGYAKIGSDGIRENSKGERASFELLYPVSHWTERLSILKEQAKKAGVEIQLKMMQQGLFNAVLNRKYQAWCGSMTTYYYPTYWQSFAKSNADTIPSNNYYGYSSPEMEKLIEIERTATDLRTLSENSKAIQRLIDKDAVIIPDYYLDFSRVGVWKWVRFPAWGNLKFDGQDFLNPIYGYFWIDEDIKKEVENAMSEGKTFEPKIWRLSSRYVQE